MENYCDQLVLRIAEILRTENGARQLVAMGVKGYGDHNVRGFIPLVFEAPKHAQDMVTNYTRDKIIRVPMHYIPEFHAAGLDIPELHEMIAEYDPTRECVCIVSISWEKTTTDSDTTYNNASMKPFIIARV